VVAGWTDKASASVRHDACLGIAASLQALNGASGNAGAGGQVFDAQATLLAGTTERIQLMWAPRSSSKELPMCTGPGAEKSRRARAFSRVGQYATRAMNKLKRAGLTLQVALLYQTMRMRRDVTCAQAAASLAPKSSAMRRSRRPASVSA
jgi:hypothetical protein